MTVLRLRTLALSPLLAAALAGPALASIAIPPSGTPLNLLVGESFTIKLKNAQGCSFDYTASAMDPLRLDVAPASGTDVKGAAIVITALIPGETELTIMSMNGSCPPAMHTYPVTVLPDYPGILKQMDLTTKLELKSFGQELKAGYSWYSSTAKDLAVSYKDGALTNDQLQDGFDAAANQLFTDVYGAGSQAYVNVIGAGTQLFADNGVTTQAPMELFAGGGGSFQKFQDSVCGDFSDFHRSYGKLSASAIKSFQKAGAPRFGQWCTVPPLFAGGPFYPSQAGAFALPQPLAGPMILTLAPTTNVGRNNGRLLVSGMAASLGKPPFHVSLTREENGQAPVTTDFTPTITLNRWSTTFPNLLEGAYVLKTGYEDDVFKVELPISVASQDP